MRTNSKKLKNQRFFAKQLFFQKNRKAADKIISVYWFVILFIVAGAIVYMVWAFYGNPLDVREVEANIMINQVADCLSQNGKLVYELNDDFGNNFKEICHLNFDTEFEGQGEYYLEVNFYDFDDLKTPLPFRISEGNINLHNTYRDTPKTDSITAVEKSFYILDEEEVSLILDKPEETTTVQDEMVINVTSIIRKTEKNVR